MAASLDDLVVDEGEIDQRLLSSILAPYARIARQTGRPIFTGDFATLSESDKIVVFLLARKAGFRLGLLKEPEEVGPKEISAQTGVRYGTVKPTVVGLADKGVLASRDGRY